MKKSNHKISSSLYSSVFAGIVFMSAGAIVVLPGSAIAQVSSQTPAMQGSAQVAMTLYQLKAGADGRQYVVARDGSMVPLPPPGMAPGAAQVAVYGDGKGNFWYQAPNGMAVPINDSKLTWNSNQSYAPKSEPEKKKSRREERRERRQGLLGSFLGAAAGATVGSMMTNSYHGLPYGTPVYGNPNSMYYVGPNGSQVYLNLNEEALSSLYNQWNTQQQLIHQNRLNYQNQAQQSALQYQQQRQQSAIQHQQQVQQGWLNTQQQAINSRQQAQQGWVDAKQKHYDNRQQALDKRNQTSQEWKDKWSKNKLNRAESKINAPTPASEKVGNRFKGRADYSDRKEVSKYRRRTADSEGKSKRFSRWKKKGTANGGSSGVGKWKDRGNYHKSARSFGKNANKSRSGGWRSKRQGARKSFDKGGKFAGRSSARPRRSSGAAGKSRSARTSGLKKASGRRFRSR